MLFLYECMFKRVTYSVLLCQKFIFGEYGEIKLSSYFILKKKNTIQTENRISQKSTNRESASCNINYQIGFLLHL